jgi:hypothetical protein
VAIGKGEGGGFTYDEFLSARRAPGLDAVVAGGRSAAILTDGAVRERITFDMVSGNFFDAVLHWCSARGDPVVALRAE